MSDGGLHAVSVDEYVRQFVRKVTEDEKFSVPDELDKTSRSFHALLRRLAQDGDREDVRLAFKTLKQEFGAQWRSASMARRDKVTYRLFTIMDVVHNQCIKSLRPGADANPINTVILEEFRLRIAKMVTGETWEHILPLRVAALKRMYKYSQRENDVRRQTSSGSYTDRPHERVNSGKLAVNKLLRSVTGSPLMGSWTAVFDGLSLTSGAKLAPLLRALLEENAGLAEDVKTLKTPTGSGGGETKPLEPAKVKNGKVLSKEGGPSVQTETARVARDVNTEQGSCSTDGVADVKLLSLSRLSLVSGNLIDLSDAVFSPKLAPQLNPPQLLEDTSLMVSPRPLPRAVLSEPLLSDTLQSHEWVAFADDSSDVRPKNGVLENQLSPQSTKVSGNSSVGDFASVGTSAHPSQSLTETEFSALNGDVESSLEQLDATAFATGLPQAPRAFGSTSSSSNGLSGMGSHPILPTSPATLTYPSKAVSMVSPGLGGCHIHPLESLDPLKRQT